MLSHALHPAGRFRRVALLLAGGVAIASAFTAHGWFTAAAAPGSLLPNRPAPRPTMLPADLDTTPPLSVEVLAPTEGRSDAAIYKRVLEIQRAKDLLQEPGGLIRTQAPADGSWAFFLPERPKIYPEGTWVTDQESILIAANARWEGDTLHADRARLRLPGGSKLRVVFEGRMVRAEPGPDQIDRVLVTEGEIRILDEQGATRIQIRADGNGILIGTAVPTPGEIAFDISAADDHAGLLATMNTRADAPEDEQQPPHGAPRWKLHTPPPGGGATELRMQWNYNLGELQFLNLEGC